MRIFYVLTLIISILSLSLTEAQARKKQYSNVANFTKAERYSALVVDASNGDVIYQSGANKILYPASLTKLMTLYLAFEAIDENRLSYHQQIPVSLKASMQPKTKLFLKHGQKITVRDAILSLIVKSANDSALVLAEAIDGSEEKFARRMTNTAKQLGMKNTVFKNASGLPHPEQITTAYDMARLGIALRRDYPKYYGLFSKTSFKYKGNIVTSHNRVLSRYKWADGLKTGYTNLSGFNLITSTSHPNAKLVGVVMGGPTANVRDNHMIQLLDHSYQKLATRMQQKGNRPMVASSNNDTKLDMKPKTSHATMVSSMGVFELVDVKTDKYIAAPTEPDSGVFKVTDELEEFAGFDHEKNAPLSEVIAYSESLTNKLHKKQETKILNKKVKKPTKDQIKESKNNKKKAIKKKPSNKKKASTSKSQKKKNK